MTPYEWTKFCETNGTPALYREWITSVQESEGIASWIYGENGEHYILTKTGNLSLNEQKFGEWLQTRQTTGELITKAEADATTGAIEVYSGDVIDTATGTVLKKGAGTASVKLGTVASAGCAVVGGVVAGVDMYQSNPEFWTALSQTLLPFCYENPTEGGWDNVWDALFPVAVDSDGKTMIPMEAMRSLYNFFAESGVLDPSGQIDISTVDKSVLNFPNYDYSLFPCPVPVYSINSYSGAITNLTPSTGNVFAFWPGSTSVEFISTEPFTVTRTITGSSSTYTWTASAKTKNNLTYYVADATLSQNPPTGVYQQSNLNKSNWSNGSAWDVAYLAFHGTSGGGIVGLSPENGAVVPVTNQTLEERYPTWTPYSSYNITENPETGEQTIEEVKWLPISLPTGNPSPTNFFTDKNQANSRTGNATEPEVQTKIQPFTPTLNPTIPQDPNGNTGNTPPIVPPFNGALAGIFHVYHPTLNELQALNSYMWSQDISKLLAEIFNNNPVDAVIGLQSIYVTPHDGGRANIKLGYMDSEVESAYVDEQFLTFSCGNPVIIPEYFQTAYDYEPYTKVYIYLPFIGIHPLSAYDIIGGAVEVEYTVDIITGVCCAKVYVTKGTEQNRVLLYTFDGSCACELPVTSASRANQVKSAVGGAIGGAMTGAMMGGAVGAVAGAVVGGIGGAARGADISMSGSLTGIAGACAPRIPYIIVKRTKPYNADNYNAYYGNPANASIRLGDVTGFTRVKKVHVDTIARATNEEKLMIQDMLMKGIII